jgi:hypothetical protein
MRSADRERGDELVIGVSDRQRAPFAQGDAMNLVPLPYSRVAVQHAEFSLDEASIVGFLRGKDAWFETDYIVFRRGEACAVARIEKSGDGQFRPIAAVEIVALPESSRFVEDPAVDTGNACALAEKARALGVGPSETLVVSGLYEHVCFIHQPQPVIIDVFDLSPPEPPRLIDMARRVLAYKSLPPTVLRSHVQSIPDLAREVDKPLLYPCGIAQLKRSTKAFYLDERPARRDWVLVGCERSRQIHRHLYGEDCACIELCPRNLFDPRGALALMRCCLVEKKVEISGRVAFVPWGAEITLIEDALASLLQLARQAD